MLEEPSRGRASIERRGNDLIIEIPSKKQWFVIIFLGVWLGGWVMGEAFALGTLLRKDTPIFADTFMLFWLTGWTVGGVFAITTFLWMVVGVESITVERNTLTIFKNILGLGTKKKYDLNHALHFAVDPQPEQGFFNMGQQRNLYGMKGGVLKFDYGMKTIKFASGIDEAEGRMLLNIFKENANFKQEQFA